MTVEHKQEIGLARASPTKEFFVRMLTRDIELGDAILDLLDNCLDGILRTAEQDSDSDRPYEGFRAVLKMSPGEFVIEDNCGGIPLETAKKYAFAMGRPPHATDHTPATIGMYGIGMKRAIFKLGINAVVESRFGDEDGFYVEFTPEWMSTDTWEDLTVFGLDDAQGFPDRGTRITVLELGHEARSYFADPAKIEEFRVTVSRHYALILAKGFEVVIQTPDQEDPQAIKPKTFELLKSHADWSDKGIHPYAIRGRIDDVSVEIYAGLYRRLLSQQEIETEEDGRSTSDDAGWTVACNDRVVIWKDKTRLTGWGEANVPNYHGQFIPITGIVMLRADDPSLLPLTTTKRGIDAASNVFLEVKDFMREATKSLTTFTNRWKKFPEDRNTLYSESRHVTLSELKNLMSNQKIPARPVRGKAELRRFKPNLPEPKQQKTSTRISYLVENTELTEVVNYFYHVPAVSNADVGKMTFDLALSQTRESSS